jgi:hypothetical protein
MRCGFELTLAKQGTLMSDFFHGVPGKQPSQLQMLAEGTSIYKELYETTTQTIVSRNKKSQSRRTTAIRYCLKSSLTRNTSEYYYTDKDITLKDLQKKIEIEVTM